MLELSPSLLSADFTNLKKKIDTLNKLDVKYLHLDVMDGMFVPNISFGPMIIKKLRPLTNMIFDVHLMIEDPDRYIENFKDAGANMKAGVSINPATHPDVLDYVLDDIDVILVMSVNPGFGGQKFIKQTIEKILKIREKIDKRNLDIILEVDGGIKTTNVQNVIESGANLIVSGSDVFCDKENKIREYKEIFKNYKKD